MPQPTKSDVHVNGPLTNISVAWIQDASHFVAQKVFPIVPVENASDLYYEFDIGDFMRDEAEVRGESSESAGSGYRLSTTPYSCRVVAFHKDIDDQVRANADSVLSLDMAATAFVSQKMAISRERKFAANHFVAGVWGTDVTPAILWDAANSTPRKDVDAGKASILTKTGFIANTLTVSYPVFLALRSNADVRDQFKYVSEDSIDEAMLARYFDVQYFYVAKAVYNTAKQGSAHAGTLIMGKNALLTYTPPTPGHMTPAAGYCFAWRGFTGSINGQRVKKFRMENIASDRVEAEHALDFKRVAASLGYFFSAVVA